MLNSGSISYTTRCIAIVDKDTISSDRSRIDRQRLNLQPLPMVWWAMAGVVGGAQLSMRGSYGYYGNTLKLQRPRLQASGGKYTMYKLDIRVDTKESAAIERRRNLERQRQSRIFNARERTIGVGLLWLCYSLFYLSCMLSGMLPAFLYIFKCLVPFSVFCCCKLCLTFCAHYVLL